MKMPSISASVLRCARREIRSARKHALGRVAGRDRLCGRRRPYIRRRGTAAFISMPRTTRRSILPFARADGWYEEDCAWAAVAQAFPELFTEYEWRCADRTIRDWYPDAWEAIHGRPLRPGESHEKDRRNFERDHAIRLGRDFRDPL